MAYGRFEPSNPAIVQAALLAHVENRRSPGAVRTFAYATEVAHTPRFVSALALPNRFLGIALTKDSKYRKAVDKAKKYEDKYRKCKAKRLSKGKKAWPTDKGRALSGNCRHDYERWQHWEEKAADRARALKEKLGKKGKLDPGMAEELDAAMAAPSKAASAEYAADKAEWKREQDLAYKKANYKGGGSSAEAVSEEPAIEDYTAEAAVDYTIPLIAVGAVALLGVGAAVLYSKNKKKPAVVAA